MALICSPFSLSQPLILQKSQPYFSISARLMRELTLNQGHFCRFKVYSGINPKEVITQFDGRVSSGAEVRVPKAVKDLLRSSDKPTVRIFRLWEIPECPKLSPWVLSNVL